MINKTNQKGSHEEIDQENKFIETHLIGVLETFECALKLKPSSSRANDTKKIRKKVVELIALTLMDIDKSVSQITEDLTPERQSEKEKQKIQTIKNVFLRLSQILLLIILSIISLESFPFMSMVVPIILISIIGLEVVIFKTDYFFQYRIKYILDVYVENLNIGIFKPIIRKLIYIILPMKKIDDHNSSKYKIKIDHDEMQRTFNFVLDDLDSSLNQLDELLLRKENSQINIDPRIINFFQSLTALSEENSASEIYESCTSEALKLLTELGYEVHKSYPDKSTKLWNVIETNSIKKPRLELPAMTKGNDVISRGIVYVPSSKTTT